MTYVCTLDVSRELVQFVARLLAAERCRRGTRRGTRRLTPFHQARFALAWFRDRCDIERLGAGFGLAWATAYRYLDEALCVLSDQAPDLQQALERAVRDGLPYLILDGTIIACDRLAEMTTGSDIVTVPPPRRAREHPYATGVERRKPGQAFGTDDRFRPPQPGRRSVRADRTRNGVSAGRGCPHRLTTDSAPGRRRKRRRSVLRCQAKRVNKKPPTAFALVGGHISCCGRSRIRTWVGYADGFTVRSHWPLGQSAVHQPLAG